MTYFNRFIFGLFFIAVTSVTFAASATSESIQQLGQHWEQAIAERNPSKITALYDENALLYATFSNFIDSQAGILNYFTKLVKHDNLKVTFTKQNIRVYGDVAINSGLYVFSYTDHDKKVTVPCRYTFVYYETPSGWIIIDHHSSVVPEKEKVNAL